VFHATPGPASSEVALRGPPQRVSRMVFGFKKKKKDDDKADPDRASQVGAEGAEDEEPIDLPEGIEPKDANKWRKLLKYLDENPLFSLATFDGLYWLDPFKAEFVSAPFDVKDTVKSYFAVNHHWMKSKLKPGIQLRAKIWLEYLKDNINLDQRYTLFRDDGAWFNPWTCESDPEIRMEHQREPKAFMKKLALKLAKDEDARPEKMRKLEVLQQKMAGVEVPDEDEEEQRRKSTTQGIRPIEKPGATGSAGAEGGTARAERQVAERAVEQDVDELPVIEGGEGFLSGLSAQQGTPPVPSPQAPGHGSGAYPTAAGSGPHTAVGHGSGGYPAAPGSGQYPAAAQGSGQYPIAALGSGQYPAVGHGSGGHPPVQGQPPGGPPAVQGAPPAAGYPVQGGMPVHPAPGVPMVQGVPFFNGVVSMRGEGAPRTDDEEGEASEGGGGYHLPAGVPVMSQSDLSPETIKALVDSLREVSLFASSMASYRPGTEREGSGALTRIKDREGDEEDDTDPFELEGEDSEGEDSEGEEREEVSTDQFVDPDASLDIDVAFARLQARSLRGNDDEWDDEDGEEGEEGEEEDEDVDFGEDEAAGAEDFDLGDLGDVEFSSEDDHAQDMEKARSVQNHLLGGIPPLEGIEIGLHYVPFSAIGGDFYNVVRIDEDRFFFIVGDVSGHGVQAALVVSSIVNTLRIIFKARDDYDLYEIVCELNDYMRECLMTGQFFTAFAGVFTRGETPILECISAGHNPSLRINPGKDREVEEIGGKGMGLGLVRSTTFRAQTKPERYELAQGDIICVYTDGIVEVVDDNGDELGDQFVRSSLAVHAEKPLHEIIEGVLGDIHAEMVGEIQDDQTVLALKVL